MLLNPKDLEWRYGRLTDADDVRRIYAESVGNVGVSPVIRAPTLEEIQRLIASCNRSHFPLWTLHYQGTLVAWMMIRPIAWGPDVCARTGDLSMYVANEWQGKGVSIQVLRCCIRDVRRHGFDTITAWIFASNRKSLTLARAMRMKRWAHMPGIADFGGVKEDVEVWGLSFDDPEWVAFSEAHEARHERRYRYLAAAAKPEAAEATASTS